jgi:hypothetical protein
MAFTPLPASFVECAQPMSKSEAFSTALGLVFGKQQQQVLGGGAAASKQNINKTKTTKSLSGGGNKMEKQKKKEPFIFLFGKPQYDWVKGEIIPHNRAKDHKWLVKSADKKKL